jgi:hypothetical protein
MDKEVPTFNVENSNLLNYSHNNIGLFDHNESNMNLLRNHNIGNNSIFFGDNMFNSNHLNSMFLRNNDDSMMRTINNNFNNVNRDLVVNNGSKVKESGFGFNNLKEENNNTNTNNFVFNKPK